MKKAITALLLLFALLLPMTSGVVAEEQPRTLTPPAVESASPAEPAEVFLPGSVPALSAPFEAINLPLNAVALAMVEHNLAYNSADDAFVWTALYYALSIFGQMDDRAQLTDEALLVPSETVQDYLRALFRDRSQLPPLPTGPQAAVSYDPVTDLYALTLGDLAQSTMTLDAPSPAHSGLVSVTGTLTDPGSGQVICHVQALLETNESMFGCSIVQVDII